MMENFTRKPYLWLLLIGTCLILAGLIIQIPGGALTTYSSLNGQLTEYYEFDNKYSAIDEYVGGDAYNYIIGASLVAGKMAGAMASKAICFTGGAMCIACGLTLMVLQKQKHDVVSSAEENAEKPADIVEESKAEIVD